MDYPDFEIGLFRRDTASYAAQVRFHAPGQEDELRAEAYPIRFDFAALRQAAADSAAYGRLLGKDLLGPGEVLSCWHRAQTVAQKEDLRLRLRLSIDRWSTELHALRWETLRDPETGRSLLMDDKILFSRYLGSFDMRPVRLRSKTSLRALVAVANPSDLDNRSPGGRALAPIVVPAELQRARDSLGVMAVTELPAGQPVTLQAILDHLRGEYDVLYLVCHGALIDDEPRLWLENQQGGSAVTSGVELVDGLARLFRLPRLVVLVSCQSAGSGQEVRSDDGGVLSALGPRLAEAGVPAVIAMQGNVLQRTVAGFLPVFFRELSTDGQLDRAMGEARFAVRGEPDHWAPVLYSRLANNQLWYDCTSSGAPGFNFWPDLIDQIKRHECIPVLGSGMLEPYVGLTRGVAYRLAKAYHYPMPAGGREDLPQVAQYLKKVLKPNAALNSVFRAMDAILHERFPELPPAADGGRWNEALAADLKQAWHAYRRRKSDESFHEPHLVLAEVGFPVYVSTNPDDLLLEALREQGSTPNPYVCTWNDRARQQTPNEDDFKAMLAPTPARPLVYQLFGRLQDLNSLVLAEDDYFDFLMEVTRKQQEKKDSTGNRQDMLHTLLSGTLASAGLLFLGFRIDDWDFRSFFRFLMRQPGGSFRNDYLHIAVQLNPEEGTHAEAAQVKTFLEKFFGPPSDIHIFWGSAEEFTEELYRQWQAHHP